MLEIQNKLDIKIKITQNPDEADFWMVRYCFDQNDPMKNFVLLSFNETNKRYSRM